MTGRPVYVTTMDLELLSAIARTGSVAAASRSLGISRDLGVYRLNRLPRASGGPVVVAERGGAHRGGTRLTARGWALLRGMADSVRPSVRPTPPLGLSPTRHTGEWHSEPYPRVEVSPGVSLAVTFTAGEGERVRVAIDPESVLLARRRFATSARNVLAGAISRLLPVSSTVVGVEVRVRKARFLSLVTRRALRSLGLTTGSAVVLYLKATAIRRL